MRIIRIVFLWGIGCAVSLSSIGQPSPAASPSTAASAKPQVFGAATTYVTVGEWEFVPTDSSHAWGDKADNNNLAQKYAKEPYMVFIGGPKLPSGALLTTLEFDYCDDNAAGLADVSLYLQDYDYKGNALSTLTTISSSGAPGCTYGSADLTPFNYTVDNFERRLVFYVTMGSNGDDTTRFSGVIIGYRLQVSPAPAIPTFNDVPTTDFGFQYIEALVASAITGGTGGGNYSPDAYVTRRQMAIFISKALGLSYH